MTNFYANHPLSLPQQTHQTLSSSTKQGVSTPNNLTLPAKTENDAIIGKQYARDLAKMILLYAATDGTTVTAPAFSSTFLDFYCQASAEDNKRLLMQSYADHCNTRSQSRDYLKWLTTCPLMNNSMASYFLKAQLHAQALDDDQHLLEASISMISFLSPPVSTSD